MISNWRLFDTPSTIFLLAYRVENAKVQEELQE